jgi:hypothetical protein
MLKSSTFAAVQNELAPPHGRRWASAYALASIAMDCRIGEMKAPEKSVYDRACPKTEQQHYPERTDNSAAIGAVQPSIPGAKGAL